MLREERNRKQPEGLGAQGLFVRGPVVNFPHALVGWVDRWLTFILQHQGKEKARKEHTVLEGKCLISKG